MSSHTAIASALAPPGQPQLSVEHLPAEHPVGHLPIFLLHGWGHDRASWAPLVPQLRRERDVFMLDLPGFGESGDVRLPRLQDTLTEVARLLPARCVLLGWSLGGHLALELARLCPRNVAAAITLATNRRFVASQRWPHAMAPEVFSAFARGFAESPRDTLKRFCGLQAQGDTQRKMLLKDLRGKAAAPLPEQQAQWQATLQWLAEVDHTNLDLAVPLLQLFGEEDALVPVAAARAQASGGLAQVATVAGAGHALHLSHTREVQQAISAFLEPVDGPAAPGVRRPAVGGIDKGRMARSFSRAAASYDSVAHVQSDVGRHLLQQCPAIAADAQLLDLGCGTGFCTSLLQGQGAQVTSLDIAPGMLYQARQKLPAHGAWVCADAERLPFSPGHFAGIVSNLTVQWSQNLPGLFAGLRDALKPGGWVLFSTLGPETLHELRQAWRAVDDHPHVNDFASEDALRAGLRQAGLEVERFTTEHRVPVYHQLRDLMRELKALGAHNVAREQQRGLNSPRDLRCLTRAYETFRGSDGLLPATYQVYYVLARRPV